MVVGENQTSEMVYGLDEGVEKFTQFRAQEAPGTRLKCRLLELWGVAPSPLHQSDSEPGVPTTYPLTVPQP